MDPAVAPARRGRPPGRVTPEQKFERAMSESYALLDELRSLCRLQAKLLRKQLEAIDTGASGFAVDEQKHITAALTGMMDSVVSALQKGVAVQQKSAPTSTTEVGVQDLLAELKGGQG